MQKSTTVSQTSDRLGFRAFQSAGGEEVPCFLSPSQQKASKEQVTVAWIRDVRKRRGEKVCLIHQAHIRSTRFFLPRIGLLRGRLRFLSPPVRWSHEAFEVHGESAVGPDWNSNATCLKVSSHFLSLLKAVGSNPVSGPSGGGRSIHIHFSIKYRH